MHPKEKKQSLRLAEHYFRENNYSFAQAILDKITKIDPNNSKANELLSYIYGNLGKFDKSYEFLKVACNQNNCSSEALYYFGSAQLKRGHFEQAIESLKKSMSKGGREFFEALHDLATAQAHIGDLNSAINNYQKCLSFNVTTPELFFNIARIFDDLKRFDEAIAHYDKALSLKPNYAEAWSNKGLTLHELRRYSEALIHYDRVLSLKPDYAEAWFNKGNTLHELRRYSEAMTHYDQALSLKPNYAEVWCNKGVILHELRRYDEAMTHYDKALSLKPDYAEAWFNKGASLNELKQYEKAIIQYDQALSLRSDISWLYGDITHAKIKICNWTGFEDALGDISKKLMANEKTVQPFSLLTLSDDALLHKKSAEINIQSKYPFNPVLGPILKCPKGQKIRLGYYSGDFHIHAIGYLMAELFELHDKSQFELIGLSFGPITSDEMRLRIEKSFDQFIEVGNKSDIEIAQLSRSLNIDIAVDLKGFTQDSRTGIFSHRVAPIQVNYLGYPGTMGADYIDYIIADKTLIPLESQSCYSEKVIYLPNSYQVNDRKRLISDRQFTRQELGLPEDGFIFCCFNNNFKILPATFARWMRILKAVDRSILWLLEDNAWAVDNLKAEAENQGISAHRLVFAERMPLPEHLSRHRQADLFLDTLPYNAHTTASDALWTGLPVLTMMGKSFASRVAASLLTAISLPELIANTQEEYEAIAIDFATNPQKLAYFKKILSNNCHTAPLFDTPLFTKHIEAAYKKIYDRYHEDLRPEHMFIA
jgi:predicted O-linked N-acetylglucosamine transferase (SPINDLY family)